MRKAFLFLFVSLLVFKVVDAKRYIANQDFKVREGKSNKSDTLGTIKKGTIIETKDTVGKWRKVQDQDEVGYVNEKYLDEAPKEILPAEDGTINANVKQWIANHQIVSLAGLVVLLLILRSVALSISARRSEKHAVQVEEKYKSLIKYWFQCKHCAASIKNDVEPGTNGCSKSLHHLWTNLGEVGQHKYHCKNCGVTVHTKVAPNDHGCPESSLHRWEKKR